jgi:hypothetical protein
MEIEIPRLSKQRKEFAPESLCYCRSDQIKGASIQLGSGAQRRDCESMARRTTLARSRSNFTPARYPEVKHFACLICKLYDTL